MYDYSEKVSDLNLFGFVATFKNHSGYIKDLPDEMKKLIKKEAAEPLRSNKENLQKVVIHDTTQTKPNFDGFSDGEIKFFSSTIEYKSKVS